VSILFWTPGTRAEVRHSDVLRLLDVLLPRILWGKVQPLPHQTTHGSSKSIMDPAAFAYVKRDLVRMIGIVCHKDLGVQDRIRLCGGIYVVLNLCVVDERNPCVSSLPLPTHIYLPDCTFRFARTRIVRGAEFIDGQWR
jgi:Spinocerebellar ataxia type 10 protein domain